MLKPWIGAKQHRLLKGRIETAMNNTPPSKLATVGIYILALIGLMVLLLIIDFIGEMAFQFSILDNFNAVGVVMMMFAASLAGQFYFNRAKAAPSGATSWLLAFYFALANTILGIGIISLFSFVFDLSDTPLQQLQREFQRPGFLQEQLPLILLVLAVILLLVTLVNRLSFGMGIRNARKAFERKQALKVNEFK